jgi:hypothetical protein
MALAKSDIPDLLLPGLKAEFAIAKLRVEGRGLRVEGLGRRFC